MDPRNLPEFQLDLYWRNKFFEKYGRYPETLAEQNSFEQIASKEMLRDAEKSARELAKAEREKAAAEQQVLDKQAAARIFRLRRRYDAPENYRPASKITDLIDRLSSNETFLAGTRIIFDPVPKQKNQELLKINAAFSNLSRSVFENANFSEGTSFEGADLSDSEFTKVRFCSGCDLSDVNFSGAKFKNVIFEEGAIVRNADFSRAFFDSGSALEFDGNFVSQANLEMRRNAWQSLTRAYSGVFQFLNILFAFAYFGPLLLQTYVLGIWADLQNLSTSSSATPVWQVVFGGVTFDFWAFSLALLILGYQGIRFWMTLQLSPMIEDQRMGGRTPLKSSYKGLAERQPYVAVFGWLVVVLFAFDLYDSAFARVCLVPSGCLELYAPTLQ